MSVDQQLFQLLYTHVMLILILTDVQYLQNVFSFEKGSNGQKYSLSDSHHPIKKSPPPQQNFPFPPLGALPLPLNAIWKTLPTGGIPLTP